ncbi:MAG: hypothetical protein IJH34_17920 [Romboutsia sp.]|nr:hypothetical protein [Romboutsia sp.]
MKKKTIIASLVLCCSIIVYNPIKKFVFAEQDNATSSKEYTILTKEQAEQILINYNNDVDYIYQGNENDFEYLKSNGLKGYVYLPDIETDIGYFIDQYNSNIYYFHPSGFFELVK